MGGVYFPFPRPVDMPKNIVCPTTYPLMGGRIVGCIIFPRVLPEVKCTQPRPGFELGSPRPFPTRIIMKTTRLLPACLCVLVGTSVFEWPEN